MCSRSVGHVPRVDGLLEQATKSLYSGSLSLVHFASTSGGVWVQWPQNSVPGFADDYVLLPSLSNGLQLSLERKRQGRVLASTVLGRKKGRMPAPGQGGSGVLTEASRWTGGSDQSHE